MYWKLKGLKSLALWISNPLKQMDQYTACVNNRPILPKHYCNTLYVSYLHPESCAIIEEKGLYNFSEMLADIGGFLGLTVGASCLSILELVICIALMVLKRFFK